MPHLLLALALASAVIGLACTSAGSPSSPAAPAKPAASAPAPSGAAPTAASAPAAAAPAPRKIRIAQSASSLSNLPARLADDKGFLRAEGLEVEWLPLAGELSVPALLTNEIDFSMMPSSIAAATAQGAPLKIVAMLAGKLQHQLVVKPEITSIADLRGKRIAVQRPGDLTGFEGRWLADHYNIPDVAIVSLGRDSERLTGVLTGAADATILPVPADIRAEKEGLKVLLAIGSVLEVPLAGYGTSEEKIARGADEIARLMRGTIRANQHLMNPANSEDVAGVIARWVEIPIEDARTAFDRVRDTYLPASIPTDAQMQNYVNMLRATASAGDDVTVDQLADFSIARRVAAEMGVTP